MESIKGKLSEEVIEEIVDRVIEKLKDKAPEVEAQELKVDADLVSDTVIKNIEKAIYD